LYTRKVSFGKHAGAIWTSGQCHIGQDRRQKAGWAAMREAKTGATGVITGIQSNLVQVKCTDLAHGGQ